MHLLYRMYQVVHAQTHLKLHEHKYTRTQKRIHEHPQPLFRGCDRMCLCVGGCMRVCVGVCLGLCIHAKDIHFPVLFIAKKENKAGIEMDSE